MKYQQNGAGGNESKKDSSSSNWWVWLLVGIAALCVGGVAAGLFIMKKKDSVSFQNFQTRVGTDEQTELPMTREMHKSETITL